MSAHCRIPVEDRFMIVRRQLDELGYKQSLKIDGLPLAEQLLADLIHTTESLRRYKDLAQQALEKCNLLEQGSQPYINENARLVRDCNDMHNKLLHLKEASQSIEKDHKKKLKSYETEVSDQKFLTSQLTARIEELQKESAAKTKKLLEQKKFDAIITVPAGGRKRSFTFRRPKMEIDVALTAAPLSQRSNNSNKNSPPVDMLRLLEKQSESLSQELKAVREQRQEQAEQCSTLQQQIKTRDEEIERLQKMLDGGMPVTAVIRDHELEKMSHHQEKVNSLEAKIKEATTKQHEAMANAVRLAKRNERLEREMNDMDKMACAINSEKSALSKKLAKTEDDFKIFRSQYEDMELENRKFREQKGPGLEICNKEKRQLQKKLETAQTELKNMKSREQDLMLEIQRLTEGRSTRSRPTSQTRKPSTQAGSSRGVPQNRSDNKDSTESKKVEVAWKETDRNETVQAQKELTTQQMILIQTLQAERDKLASECQTLKADIARLSSATDSGGLRMQLSERNKELAALQQANNNLIRELNSAREKIVHSSAQSGLYSERTNAIAAQLEKERDSARANIRKLQDEIESLREQLRAAPTGSARMTERPPSGASMAEERLRQLETERREMLSAQGQLETQRQELIVAQGTHRSSISNLEQQLRTTEAELTRQKTQYLQLKSLHEQTVTSLAGLQSEMTHIRRDLAEAQARQGELAGLQAEVTGLREERNRLRSNVSQADQQRDALVLQVDEKSERIASLQSELRAKESWISTAERNYAELKKQLEGKKFKCRHKIIADIQTITSIPIQRPAKSNKVNPSPTKPHPAAPTKPNCNSKSRPGRWIKYSMQPPRSSEDASLANQQDARGLQREVERLRQEHDKASTLRDASQREIKRLQDDLAAALLDCKVAQRDLALSQREAEDLKQRMQDYVAEVERIEQLLTQKEDERTGLLEHFRSLSQEASELETHNHTLKSETTEVKRTLQVTEGHISQLEDQLATSKSLIFSYESQIVELTQHVNGLEAQLLQVRDQAQNHEKDLNAVRDLCMKLDNQKETLQDDLMDSKRQCTEMEATVSHLQQELETMQSQLCHEVGNKGALQTVLERSREESLQQRLSNEDLTAEMQRLREQVVKLQQSQDRAEFSQRQAAECSRQVDELRRQVANEKFEKARMSEESRSVVSVEVQEVASASPSLSLQSLSPESSD